MWGSYCSLSVCLIVSFSLFEVVRVSPMGVRRHFSRGAKSKFCLYFSVFWRWNANRRKQKMSNVTATVTYSVCPIRKFYTEKMFVLVRMDILRLLVEF